MSNLLKSKFLLGVMTVAIMFVGVVAVSNTASAASCTITTTLRVGSKGAEVKCLQAALDHGLVGDGVFGPKTKAQVVAWQASVGLTADGVFGAKSRAAWMGGAVVSTGYPAGCTSSTGYSSTTGMPCTGTVVTTYPVGCTSSAGYSTVTGASCATGAVNNQTGPIQVSLAADNPASGYIIANQATADLAHFTFTGTGTINTVVLQRTGISDQNTLSNVYLYAGNVRLTDGFSFNNVGQLTMNNLGIAVNGSETISVKADVANVSNASSLGITLIGFTAAGQPATTVSVKGNEMTYGTGNLASVYLATQASVAVPNASVNAGTSAYTVWSAPVQVNTRAVWLKGANFRMVGSAPIDALGNIRLYVDGVQVGSAATISTITGSNYAMFDFSAMPVQLTTGSHTMDVRADVVKGASYTVQVSLQQAADLVLYDAQLGVNIAATVSASSAFVPNNAGTITINAGSASVVVDPTFQSMTNITGGSTNAVIARFKVHGYGEDVKVSSLLVLPSVTNACTSGSVFGGTGCATTASGPTHTEFANGNGLQNVTLFFNGSQVGSSVNWVSGSGNITFNLGSQMILPAGTDSYIEVRADLRTSVGGTYAAGGPDPLATDGANYTTGIVSAQLVVGSSNAQGQTSHTTISPGFPASSSSITNLTIQAGTLAVSKNTGYASQSVSPNSTGAKIGSYILQNQSTSESVRVTSLAVRLLDHAGAQMDSAATPATTNFSNLRTSETSGSGSTPIQPAGSNVFSVDFTIAPGATKVIDILADTSSTTSTTFSTTLVVTSLGSTSNVSIQQNGNGSVVTGQTITLATGVLDNSISLLTAPSTSQQFVPSANGATNATSATFKLTSTGGVSTISELKFTVNSQDFSSVGAYDAITTGSKTFTPTTAADAAKFAVGDSVQVLSSTGAIGIGTVSATSGNTVTVAVTVTPASGTFTGGSTALRLVPATVTGITVAGITAAPVNGVAYLTGLNLTVPNGGSGLSMPVLVSYAPVGTNGIATGSTSRVALEYVKFSSGNTTKTLCTAAIQSCDYIQAAGTVTAPVMKLVGSAPTLALNASTSTLVVGTIDVGSVTVAANAQGDITLNALPLAFTFTNASVTNSADLLVIKDSSGNKVTTTNLAPGGTTGALTTTVTFTGGYQIPAGTSQTFHINVPFTSVTASTGSATTGLGSADALSWTDTAGNATAATGLDVVGSAVTTVSNKFKDAITATATPGFFYNYPSNTVNINNFSN